MNSHLYMYIIYIKLLLYNILYGLIMDKKYYNYAKKKINNFLIIL